MGSSRRELASCHGAEAYGVYPEKLALFASCTATSSLASVHSYTLQFVWGVDYSEHTQELSRLPASLQSLQSLSTVKLRSHLSYTTLSLQTGFIAELDLEPEHDFSRFKFHGRRRPGGRLFIEIWRSDVRKRLLTA